MLDILSVSLIQLYWTIKDKNSGKNYETKWKTGGNICYTVYVNIGLAFGNKRKQFWILTVCLSVDS